MNSCLSKSVLTYFSNSRIVKFLRFQFFGLKKVGFNLSRSRSRSRSWRYVPNKFFRWNIKEQCFVIFGPDSDQSHEESLNPDMYRIFVYNRKPKTGETVGEYVAYGRLDGKSSIELVYIALSKKVGKYTDWTH